MMHKNTEWLMAWFDRMVAKYGLPREGLDWCRKLAYYMGEEGNENPSDAAITIAKAWEIENPEAREADHETIGKGGDRCDWKPTVRT